MLKENSQLKSQYKIQDEDRNYLVKQLVAVKKDNARLAEEMECAKNALKEKGEEIDVLQAKGILGGATKMTTKELSAAVGSEGGLEARADETYRQQQVRTCGYKSS